MTEAAPASGLQLDRWFEHLDGQGFRVGVRERLLVQSLLARMAAEGALPEDGRAVLALAAPLLCTSPEQQRRYAALLEQFVVASPGLDEPDDPGPRARWRVPLACAAAVVAIGLVCWFLWGRTLPAVRVPPAQPVASAPQVSQPQSTASAPAIYIPPQALSVKPAQVPAWSSHVRFWLLALGIACALALIARALERRRRQLALQGLRTDEELEHHLLHDDEPIDASPHPGLARAVARVLRQRVAGEARALDAAATLRATVAASGAFTPRWRELRRTPEYLVLVDTRHPADHHAAAALTLVDALARAGVTLHVYAYDTTPAAGCWALGALGNEDAVTRQRLPVSALATRAAGSRLLVFGAADALLQATTGAVQAWVAGLQPLTERAWFTPQPMHAWSAPEQAADDAGFLVLPLQEAALTTLAGWLSSQRLTLALDTDTPQSFPALLRGAALDWVTRTTSPPAETVDELMQQLHRMLGGTRMQWMCACAVYPALTPPLTLALGSRLVADPRGLALGLAALSALPWFRYGRMPTWLRQALVQRLAPDFRQTLEGEIRARLDAALVTGDGPVLADVATRRRRLLDALKQRRGPLHDVVLADFVRPDAEPGMAQQLPEGLRRRLFVGGDPAAGVRPGWLVAQGAVLVAAAVAATPLWPAMVGTVAPPALDALPTVFGPDATVASRLQPGSEMRLAIVGETLVTLHYGTDPIPLATWNFAKPAPALDPGDLMRMLARAGVQDRPLDMQNAEGVRLDLAAGALQLRDADDRALGSALATAGGRARLAGFTSSGSRVVALMTDGSLRSWGRPWRDTTIDVIGCTASDPSTGRVGDIARHLAAQPLGADTQVVAYTEGAWYAGRLGSGQILPPQAGQILFDGEASRALAQQVAAELGRQPRLDPGTGWQVQTVVDGSIGQGIALGTCPPDEAFASQPPLLAVDPVPDLGAIPRVVLQALQPRVEAMFAPDADTRKKATTALMGDHDYLSDAVPVALTRAVHTLASSAADTEAAKSGVINTLVLLKSAPPASLNRDRRDILRFMSRAAANGTQTQAQVALLQQRLDAVATLKPVASIQIADERQRPLAVRLKERLQANGLGVAGIENIGQRAPAAPEVRVQGASDRRIARNLRDASAQVLQKPATLANAGGDPTNDTYEIWLDRDLCISRPLPACDATPAGVSASASAPAAVASPPAVAASPPAVAASLYAVAESPGQAQAQSTLIPNSATLDLVARMEGFRATAYNVSAGSMAIGFGHPLGAEEIKTQQIRLGKETIAIGKGISQDDARRVLANDLLPTYRAIAPLVTVPLSDNQRGALVSFAYNVGMATLRGSTVLKLVNAGDFEAVPTALAVWSRNSASASASPGLQLRRQAEAALWNSGRTPDAASQAQPLSK